MSRATQTPTGVNSIDPLARLDNVTCGYGKGKPGPRRKRAQPY